MKSLLPLCAAAVAAVFATGALAAPSSRVIEFGIYETEPVASPPTGTPVGRYKLIKQTRRIPLRQGLRFGFCTEISGLEVEGKYTVTEIVRHPLMVQPNGVEQTGWNVPRMISVQDGKAYWCQSQVLKEPHELVPGKWRFVVGDGDGDFIAEEFETVKGK